ncbi:MAG: LD-carboxypeptidase [Deltaproteobacteria bacterium]|nr:LD-carboxypeptidase [Deltaproteobacteria bacterium]
MRPIKPFGLVPGDRIGIVAPASAYEKSGLKRGIEKLKWWGFDPVVPRKVMKHAQRPSDKDRNKRYEEKAKLLLKMFRDPSIAAIFCAEGGYGSIALIPYLEKVDISSFPKIFVGFSDITILLLYFLEKYRWVTFHGPTVAQEIYKGMPPITELALQEAITKRTRLGDIYGKDLHTIAPGEAQGILVGGNLTRMLRTLGTPFEIETRDRILFIEEYDEGHMKIEGDLNHLKLAGKFSRIKGIVFSEMNKCLHGKRSEMNRFLKRYFKKVDFPVLYGFPSGHGVDNITLPFGVRARISSDPPRLILDESAVR